MIFALLKNLAQIRIISINKTAYHEQILMYLKLNNLAEYLKHFVDQGD